MPHTEIIKFNPSQKKDTGTIKSRKVFSNAYIHNAQKKHFIFLNILPFISTLLAFALIPIRPPSSIDLLCLFFLWGITEFCIVAGYHRFFTHRSFKCRNSLKNFFHIGGLMAGQGGLVSWVALHRRHHECSDHEGDPHSPNNTTRKNKNRRKIGGILHAQFFWMKKHDYPNVMYYASELCRDKHITKLDNLYFHFVGIGIISPGIIAFIFQPTLESLFFGVLWGGLVRLFIVSTSIGAVNSLLHSFGSRRFNTPDNSQNSPAFALLTFGDSYHNNHHAFPRSASAGLEKYSIDPAFWIIKFFEKTNIAWDVYVPSKKRIDQYLENQHQRKVIPSNNP
ncbi:MAG: acyl-CoA desaturase [Cellvibrionaceae bacterium]